MDETSAPRPMTPWKLPATGLMETETRHELLRVVASDAAALARTATEAFDLERIDPDSVGVDAALAQCEMTRKRIGMRLAALRRYGVSVETSHIDVSGIGHTLGEAVQLLGRIVVHGGRYRLGLASALADTLEHAAAKLRAVIGAEVEDGR